MWKPPTWRIIPVIKLGPYSQGVWKPRDRYQFSCKRMKYFKLDIIQELLLFVLGKVWITLCNYTKTPKTWITPLKINMEPKKWRFGDDFSFQTGDFQVSMSIFQSVSDFFLGGFLTKPECKGWPWRFGCDTLPKCYALCLMNMCGAVFWLVVSTHLNY